MVYEVLKVMVSRAGSLCLLSGMQTSAALSDMSDSSAIALSYLYPLHRDGGMAVDSPGLLAWGSTQTSPIPMFPFQLPHI